MSKSSARSRLNPFLALTFAIVAVTGVLLFFHVRAGALKAVHEWVSVAFVAASAVHVALNWRPLIGCLRCRPTLIATVAVAALTLVLLVCAPSGPPRGGEPARSGHPAAASPAEH